ncbi:hypothetical protein RHODOSMS8_02203 [Rhodobiaceae bacterium]|nr:hypothetical protein RHODOSMS8_02203 [Rhodobiaceae bacterium]
MVRNNFYCLRISLVSAFAFAFAFALAVSGCVFSGHIESFGYSKMYGTANAELDRLDYLGSHFDIEMEQLQLRLGGLTREEAIKQLRADGYVCHEHVCFYPEAGVVTTSTPDWREEYDLKIAQVEFLGPVVGGPLSLVVHEFQSRHTFRRRTWLIDSRKMVGEVRE